MEDEFIVNKDAHSLTKEAHLSENPTGSVFLDNVRGRVSQYKGNIIMVDKARHSAYNKKKKWRLCRGSGMKTATWASDHKATLHPPSTPCTPEFFRSSLHHLLRDIPPGRRISPANWSYWTCERPQKVVAAWK